MPAAITTSPGRVSRCLARALVVALVATSACSCSVRRIAIAGLSGALASSGDVFASDEDPELVRDALPFALKTIEALHAESPDDDRLALAACRGFTQYASAFVEADAERVETTDWDEAERLRERALKLYLRARDYGLEALARRHPGVDTELPAHPAEAAARFGTKDLDLVYWTAAAWGSAIGLALDRPEIAADVDVARSMFARVLALDEAYGDGAIHERMMEIEALPEMMGGSRERARAHFARAVVLTGGHSAALFVDFAVKVAVAEQDRTEFQDLLARALAVDPDAVPEQRLSNVLAQERARHLLTVADDLFLEPLP